MKLNRLNSILTYSGLALQSCIYALFKHAPLVKPRSLPFFEKQDGFVPTQSAISRALLENFIPQFSPSSCSVASAATVLNAAMVHLGLSGDGKRITQREILEKINTVNWKERVGKSGYQGRRGLPIELLGTALESCFRAFGIPFREIQTIPLTRRTNHLGLRKKELHSRLTAFHQQENSFIVAHFNQGVFIRGLHLPHISPVGAYNPAQKSLLILDVDPDQPAPYWISLDTFFEGLCWDYGGILKPYGYSGGGYVWIRLER